MKLDLEQKVWSFWLVPQEQDVLDNHGHEQARLFMKTLDASLPISLAINRSLQNDGTLKRSEVRLNKEIINEKTL